MKRSSEFLPWLTAVLPAALIGFASPAHAQTPTQNLALSAGWNAVWLEVEPVNAGGPNDGQPKAPQDVFTNPAIQVVATPKPLAGLAEFFASDPGTIEPTTTFNQDEWQQWKRTDPTGTSNLSLVFGNRPYLIQVAAGTPTFGLPVAGRVRFFRPAWTPERYNLVGFGLEGTRTFSDFFGPSGTKHSVDRIFTLQPNGSWAKVVPGATMASGLAYWVFSAGPSTYMGPVAVDFDHAVVGKLDFGGPSDAVSVGTGGDALELDLEQLTFTNLGSAAAGPTLDLISTDAAGLALHVVSPAATGVAYVRGNEVDSTAAAVIPPATTAALGESIASQGTASLTLGARRTWTVGAPSRTNLYRLRTGAAGASFWLPVTALNSEIQQPADLSTVTPAASVAGLWIGDVVLNAATSIVVAGSPTQPTAGASAMRLILHSDASGAVRLLSQVTIMQTRTADSSVSPVPVLVVDPARIPFFEGIKERGGKRVGVRLESVAYDMPRDTSLVAQSENPVIPNSDDLIDMIVAESGDPTTTWASGKGLYTTRASVTVAAINSYLLFRGIRPPALREVYKLSLPLTGAVGPGKTLQTSAAAPLTLDPFHRSNPFRHAFHRDLPRGPEITRTFKLVLDPGQSLPDRLEGSFTETIQGLIKDTLTLTGTVELRRVSSVATLEGAQ